MEGTPKPEQAQKAEQKVSGLSKTARAALACAAFLGAAGAELPAHAATVQTNQERRETFNPELEADAFLEIMGSLEVGIDDAAR